MPESRTFSELNLTVPTTNLYQTVPTCTEYQYGHLTQLFQTPTLYGCMYIVQYIKPSCKIALGFITHKPAHG